MNPMVKASHVEASFEVFVLTLSEMLQLAFRERSVVAAPRLDWRVPADVFDHVLGRASPPQSPVDCAVRHVYELVYTPFGLLNDQRVYLVKHDVEGVAIGATHLVVGGLLAPLGLKRQRELQTKCMQGVRRAQRSRAQIRRIHT